MDAVVFEQQKIRVNKTQDIGLKYTQSGKIRITDPERDRGLHLFIVIFASISVASIFSMNLDWAQLVEGVSRIPFALSKLIRIDFSLADITINALMESVAVSILATIYSLFLGIFIAVFMAKNITAARWLSLMLSAVITFLRSIPSIIWVLLVLVCVGMGSTAGVIGMCISSTSFFAKSFAQCFEEVSDDTIEALKAMGAGKIKIFFRAILPSAFTSLLAWTSISFESNFEASSVLGTVGAGGIGYIVSNSMGRYEYGQAMFAIIIMLLFTYGMELGFTMLKEHKKSK